MCWVTYNKESAQFKHATEDIPVYKVVRKSLLSYYKNYSYILNEVHVTGLDNPYHTKYLSGAEDWKIHSGFHSYSAHCNVDSPNGVTIRVISLHGDPAIDYYEKGVTCMLECVIPKDSIYFLNEEGEYVSDHILPLRVKNW